MWKVAYLAAFIAAGGCTTTDDFDPPMPVKYCQQAAAWRAQDVANDSYTKELAPKVFRDTYNDCIRWKAKAGSWIKTKYR